MQNKNQKQKTILEAVEKVLQQREKIMPTQAEIKKYERESYKRKQEILSKMPTVTLEQALKQLKETSK